MKRKATSEKQRGGGRPGAYRTKDGTIVPGTTTITGRFKNAGALVRWAFNCGRDGIDMDSRKKDAGSSGSIAHDMIEARIHGLEPSPPSPFELGMRDGPEYQDIVQKATLCLEAFDRWQTQSNAEFIVTEQPYVSECYRFGGTIDAIGVVSGKYALIDFKTSARIYSDMLVQMGAYLQLWEEFNPDKPLAEVHLLRFGKEDAGFHHHSWQRPTLEMGRKAFLLMRELYDLDKPLEKAVG